MASKPSSIVAPPVAALLLGAAMWGVIWYPMRLLEAAGLSGLWLSLLIYTAALGGSLPVTGRRFKEFFTRPGILVPLALAAAWTNIAFVLAVLEGNIMRVLLLFYLSPLWAVVLAWFVLGERLSRLALAALGVAMGGAVLMLWNPELGLPWPRERADWLAISSGLAFALSNVLIRKGQDVSLAAKLGGSWLGVVLLAGLWLLVVQEPLPEFHAGNLLGAVAVGLLGILVMTTLVQYGVTRMPVHRSAVILLFELVAGAVSQQLLTDEAMTLMEWAGGLMIAGAAYVSARS